MDLEPIASGYGLIEGPRADDAGNLYFSDVVNGGVYMRAADGEISTVVPKRRGVGGIVLHADGGVVCSGRNICHVRDGTTRILFELEDVGGFNDLYTDADGRVLVGALRSNPFADETERTTGELWRIEREGEASMLYDDVGVSNGVGFSPDGNVLYHSDSARRHVIAHDVATDGTLNDRRAFATITEGVPDGLAVDEAGRVWVACYGGSCVMRYAPDGSVVEKIDVPSLSVTSLCHGGPDGCDVYIVTADNTDEPDRAGTIFKGRSDVAGLKAPLARI